MKSAAAHTVMVLGSGAREWAVIDRLLFERPNLNVVAIPGSSAWTDPRVKSYPHMSIAVTSREFVRPMAASSGVGLVFIGPEQPLADGMADYLRKDGFPVFGPNKEGARLETSKAYAEQFMHEYGIPTPKSQTFTVYEACSRYLASQDPRTKVIKASGLAAGKGVFLPETPDEAEATIRMLMVEGGLGEAGRIVVIQDRVFGQEFSVMVVTDGKVARCMPAVRDHKRLLDGDLGPNTGGMAAIAPVPIKMRAVQVIADAVVAGLRKRQHDYKGVFFLGCMQTWEGEILVLEINVRFGDPETIPLMMLLAPTSSLLETMYCAAKGNLFEAPVLQWRKDKNVVTVVAAAEGYPGSPIKGVEIKGIDDVWFKDNAESVKVTLAGATYDPATKLYRTNGGRVLSVSGVGSSLSQARELAYEGMRRIHFPGMQFRTDIAAGQ